jgi:hypothetical protein
MCVSKNPYKTFNSSSKSESSRSEMRERKFEITGPKWNDVIILIDSIWFSLLRVPFQGDKKGAENIYFSYQNKLMIRKSFLISLETREKFLASKWLN